MASELLTRHLRPHLLDALAESRAVALPPVPADPFRPAPLRLWASLVDGGSFWRPVNPSRFV